MIQPGTSQTPRVAKSPFFLFFYSQSVEDQTFIGYNKNAVAMQNCHKVF